MLNLVFRTAGVAVVSYVAVRLVQEGGRFAKKKYDEHKQNKCSTVNA